MSEEQVGETTALITPKPRYAFESSVARQRKKRVRQFQCCVCAVFLGIITVAVVVSVAYSINNLPEPTPSTIDNNTLILLHVKFPLDDYNVSSTYINKTDYEDALNAGKIALKQREIIEENTPEVSRETSSFRHQKVVATSIKAQNLSRIGYVEEYGSKHLNRNGLRAKMCYNGTHDVLFDLACTSKNVNCEKYLNYRSYDGSCNNLNSPADYGVAYKPFRRILKAQYADGISSPRVSKSGRPLPSARTVSLLVHRPIYRDDPKFTIMLAVFGQFIDHDITATALSRGKNGSSISCCSADPIKHPECFPVALDQNDPYYEDYNVTCMEFVRSAPAPTCCFGARQQLNQASAYIDGSVIYGSEKEVVDRLRTFEGGRLEMMMVENRSLLPISTDKDDGCNREEENEKGRYCFMAGDARANENLHLTTMHLLWARQHNSIAKNFSDLNPHWDDEKTFQETRRVIAAQLQHITYNEFLPVILGRFASEFKLTPLARGYSYDYNRSLDASIANAFAAASFRFAHTLIPTLVRMMQNDSVQYMELHRMLFNPYKLYSKGSLDSTLRGAMVTPIQANDPYFTPELKNHMFERPVTLDQVNDTKLCGLDLVSLNIQRGRDHGLPGYTSWREHCGLPRPRTFNDLKVDIDDDTLNYIQSIYSDVDDIDLYTGSISEKPLKNEFLGPTITCILVDQFIRLKRGDRHWYENPSEPHSFDPEQLAEIRKSTLASIICDNADDVRSLQPLVMRRVDETNRVIDCADISRPNWRHWREKVNHVSVPGEGVLIKYRNSTTPH